MFRPSSPPWWSSVDRPKLFSFTRRGDPSHNTAAPAGTYAGSGWQYEGYFGNFLGTAISSSHFITANHILLAGFPDLASATFVTDTLFTGGATTTYTLDTAYNSGVGFYDIPGSDLRIYKVNGTFAQFAPLYTGGSETGENLVVTGRGAPRGADVFDPIDGVTLKGWLHGSPVGTPRWGANVVAGVANFGATLGDMIYADFDAVTGVEEAHLSNRDSGGGVFIKEGGVWKLAAINYGVDGVWDTNLDDDLITPGFQHTTGLFDAALFDARNFYVGPASNPNTPPWQFVADVNPVPSSFYSSRISTRASLIAAAIPEPTTAWLVTAAAGLLIRRRRAGR